MRVSRKLSRASDRAPRPVEEHALECQAGVDQLDTVHDTLDRFWEGIGAVPDERWRMLFEVAVSEIAANIMEHAHPTVMNVRLSAVPDRVVAEFTDTGHDWEAPPEPAEFLDELAERGRGLTLARTACDEVAYERVGAVNHWRLVKRL
jgi:serine/threonine-protein kinase RsbW